MSRQSARGLVVDMEVRRGDFTLQTAFSLEDGVLVLFGPSGAGKSTVLQAIAGILTPTAGEVALDGAVFFRSGEAGRPTVNLPTRSRRVGYVFQDYALFPHLTTLGNVAYSLGRKREAVAVARDLLERVGMSGFGHRYPDELSGGQQQRVAIARALAAEPRVLLLDEPFSALDVETRRRVRGEVRRVLREAGIPVVLVTHDREEALALGDEVLVMDQGLQLGRGEPLRMLGHPSRERIARLVGVENLLPLEVTAVDQEEGIARGSKGELNLEFPLAGVQVGQQVTVALRADDILLASSEPAGLSARNRLFGRVIEVDLEGAAYRVTLDCGGTLLTSHLTGRAVHEMGIVEGMSLWAVVKASSCLVLQE